MSAIRLWLSLVKQRQPLNLFSSQVKGFDKTKSKSLWLVIFCLGLPKLHNAQLPSDA